MTVIIMANGSSTRWGNSNKLLAKIDGIPLILRTIQQVRKKGVEPKIATSNDEVKDVVGCDIIDVGETVSAEHTWLKTKPYWKGRTIILWGDVYFSDNTINEIFTSKGLKFFGRNVHFGEGYACAYDEKDFGFVAEALTETNLCDWKFYDYLVGMPLTPSKNKIWYDTNVWHECDSYTQDIDSPEEYENVLKIIANKPKEIVTISFDDGLVKSCLKAASLAYPFKLTFFISSELVKKDHGIWLNLQRFGHDIQSHGATHCRITNTNYKYELEKSYNYIEQFHGKPYIVAYPYEVSPKVIYPSRYDWVRHGVIMPQYEVDAYQLSQMVRKHSGEWKHIVFHGLDGEGYASIKSDEFKKFINWLKTQPYKVMTAADVYKEYIK